MAKQVMFGYRIVDLDSSDIFIDSGMPHLASKTDALAAARLRVKAAASHRAARVQYEDYDLDTVVPFGDDNDELSLSMVVHSGPDRYGVVVTSCEVAL